MPAIDLKRFAKETADLVEHFDQPAVFMGILKAILDKYSNRTIQKNISRFQISTLPNANVPDQVINQIVIELNKVSSSSPNSTFALLDFLWSEGTYETRLITAKLFHRLPTNNQATIECLNTYLSENSDPTIAKTFLRSGMRTIRSEKPIMYLELIQRWLQGSDPRLSEFAIKSLVIHIKEDLNINLPQVINMLIPEIREKPLAHQFTLVDLIEALAEQSETEARYFLKEVLRPQIPRPTQITFRKFSEQFPESYRNLTRELLRKGNPHS